MKLLTQEVRDALPALYTQEDTPDPLIPVKFFDPCGSATWWIIEGEDLDENDEKWSADSTTADFLMFGFCMLFDSTSAELGYVSMNELQSVKGPLGIGIERDLYWKPCRLSEVKRKLGL